MHQGKFEEEISKKFVDKGELPPSAIWNGIDAHLNAQLAIAASAKIRRYKLTTAAALLLAFISLVIQFADIEALEKEEVQTFNALQDKGFYVDASQEKLSIAKTGSFVVPFEKYVGDAKREIVYSRSESDDSTLVQNDDEERLTLVLKENLLPIKTASLELDQFSKVDERPIQFYRYASTANSSRSQNRYTNKRVFWLGAEASAGALNSSGGANAAMSNAVGQQVATDISSVNSFFTAPEVSAAVNQGISTSIGLDVGINLNKKWSLESGIAYVNVERQVNGSIEFLEVSSFNFESDGSDFIDANQKTRPIQSSYTYDLEVDNLIQIASIPIRAGYQLLDADFSVKLNGGVIANYLIGNEIRSSQGGASNTSIGGDQDWLLNGTGGIEFGYQVFNNLDVTLEPNYRHSFQTSANQLNTSGVFVQTGIRYNFN